MPILKIFEPQTSIKIGVWRLSETIEEILLQLENFGISENSSEISAFKDFSNLERKKQWLCARLLIFTLLEKKATIVYDSFGKPSVKGEKYQIGISHTNDLVTIILSSEFTVAIDIEKIGKKIERVVHKFLSTKEISHIDQQNRLYHLYLHWSAKETLFKIYSGNGLSYTEDLIISAFSPEDKGHFEAKIQAIEKMEEYLMHYLKIDGHTLVWTCKTESAIRNAI